MWAGGVSWFGDPAVRPSGLGVASSPGMAAKSCPCHVGLGCDPAVWFALSRRRRIQLLLARVSDFWAR